MRPTFCVVCFSSQRTWGDHGYRSSATRFRLIWTEHETELFHYFQSQFLYIFIGYVAPLHPSIMAVTSVRIQPMNRTSIEGGEEKGRQSHRLSILSLLQEEKRIRRFARNWNLLINHNFSSRFTNFSFFYLNISDCNLFFSPFFFFWPICTLLLYYIGIYICKGAGAGFF